MSGDMAKRITENCRNCHYLVDNRRSRQGRASLTEVARNRLPEGLDKCTCDEIQWNTIEEKEYSELLKDRRKDGCFHRHMPELLVSEVKTRHQDEVAQRKAQEDQATRTCRFKITIWVVIGLGVAGIITTILCSVFGG